MYAVHLELITEAATRPVQWKKVFLEIPQNSEENTSVRLQLYQKRDSGTGVFL